MKTATLRLRLDLKLRLTKMVKAPPTTAIFPWAPTTCVLSIGWVQQYQAQLSATPIEAIYCFTLHVPLILQGFESFWGGISGYHDIRFFIGAVTMALGSDG